MANPEPELRYSGTEQLHIPLYLISRRIFATEVVRCAQNITKSNKWNLLPTKVIRRNGKENLFFIVCFLLGNSPASEIYMPTFRNTLFHLYRQVGVKNEPLFTPTYLWRWNRQSVPKRRHIKFRRREITQKKAYSIQNKAKVWNQEPTLPSLI